MARFAYLDGPDVLAFAHRGGTIDHPENTLEAFQSAIDLGYSYIETDVHASADGELYAFHDEHLERIAGIGAYIGDLTSRELDAIRFDGYRVPRFDEVLSTWPTIRVNIDPKADAAVLPLIRTIRRHGAVDRVCVGSFSDRRIAHCRTELGPGLCTSMGPIEIARFWMRSRGLATGPLRAACAQVPTHTRIGGIVPVGGDERFIEAAHEAEIAVHVWTINDEPTMHDLVDRGVDGIMTDRPDVLRSVLIDRGRWEPAHV